MPASGGAGTPVLDYVDTMSSITQGDRVAAAVPAEPVMAAQPSTRSPHHGLIGSPAKVTLDRYARVIPHSADPAIVEHYRRLRTKIIQEQEKKPFSSLMVTSPNPQDGKTVTVLNLGFSFGMLPSYKVLIVDGDLRKGSLGKWLGVQDEQPGLSNLIDGTAELEDVVLKCDELPAYFMVRGTSTVPPGELLNSSMLSRHFQKMAEYFQLTLIDSAPVNLVTDAQLIAHHSDAVLLIARAFATTRKTFEKTIQELSPFRVIGTVLNGGMRTELYRRYNHYY